MFGISQQSMALITNGIFSKKLNMDVIWNVWDKTSLEYGIWPKNDDMIWIYGL